MGGAGDELDRASVVPLYFQLQELLKEKIETGLWRPGDAVPPERELCERYRVSRSVVRQALAILEQDRQVVREQGRGTIVAPPKVGQRAGGLSHLLREQSAESELRVLSLREEPAPVQVAQELRLAEGEPVTRLMTLLRVRGRPLALIDSFFAVADAAFLRAAAAPGATLPAGLHPDTAERVISHATVSIQTSQCSTWEGEQLEIGFRGGVYVTLVTEHVSDRGRPRPFEVARGVYRADIVQFRFELAGGGAVPHASWELAAGQPALERAIAFSARNS